MGGCATKPRDVDGPANPSPDAATNNTVKAAAEVTPPAAAGEVKVESKEEAPSADVSTTVEAPVSASNIGDKSEQTKLTDCAAEPKKPDEEQAAAVGSNAQNDDKEASMKTTTEATVVKVAEKTTAENAEDKKEAAKQTTEAAAVKVAEKTATEKEEGKEEASKQTTTEAATVKTA